MYTYTILRASEPLTMLPAGMVGELEVILQGSLAAVTEPDLPMEVLQANDETLLQSVVQHDRVIQDLFAQATLLPLRFGTYFVSRQALAEHLDTHTETYLKTLDSLQGKAEYTVRLTPVEIGDESGRSPLSTESDDTVGATGRDYFRRKKQQFESHMQLQQRQHQELDELKRAIAQQFSLVLFAEPQAGVERIHVLIELDYRDTLISVLSDWQTHSTGWTLRLDAPLPPYHFV
jgi:hypothetical protein